MDLISTIVKDNKMCRFASELQYTTNNIRKQAIKTLLEIHNNHKSAVEQFNDNNVKASKLQFKKQFSKLKLFQKEELLLNYFTKLNNENIVPKIATEQVMTMLKEKTLLNKDIIYDISLCNITEINNISNILNLSFDDKIKNYLSKKNILQTDINNLLTQIKDNTFDMKNIILTKTGEIKNIKKLNL